MQMHILCYRALAKLFGSCKEKTLHDLQRFLESGVNHLSHRGPSLPALQCSPLPSPPWVASFALTPSWHLPIPPRYNWGSTASSPKQHRTLLPCASLSVHSLSCFPGFLGLGLRFIHFNHLYLDPIQGVFGKHLLKKRKESRGKGQASVHHHEQGRCLTLVPGPGHRDSHILPLHVHFKGIPESFLRDRWCLCARVWETQPLCGWAFWKCPCCNTSDGGRVLSNTAPTPQV